MTKLTHDSKYIKIEVTKRDPEYGNNIYVTITSKSCSPTESISIEMNDLNNINKLVTKVKGME